MKFLLCNDDGYNAEGINLIYKKLIKYGEVYMVAPRNHMSAKSVSITFSGLAMEKVDGNHFIVDGTPADCCSIGLALICPDVDVVISGCNHGLNMTYDTMYSGTVGVCLEALHHNKPAIAFSCENNFEIVDQYFDQVFNYILNNKNTLLSSEFMLNVNFPLGEVVNDIKIAPLYYRHDTSKYYQKENGLFYPERECEVVKEENSDCYMVEQGIVAITPLAKTFYNDQIYQRLISLIKK